jgi:hypothetical protein
MDRRTTLSQTTNRRRERKLKVPLSRELLERILSYILYAPEFDMEMLEKIDKLFANVDLSLSEAFEDRKTIVSMIRSGLDTILVQRTMDAGIIRDAMQNTNEGAADMLAEMDGLYANDPEFIGPNILDYIDERIKSLYDYAIFYKYKDDVDFICEKMNSGEVLDIAEAATRFKGFADQAVCEINRNELRRAAKSEYIFGEDSYLENIRTTIAECRRPSSRLATGIRELNEVLGGGFLAERHYTMLGAPGTGKSVFLENALCWICCCNPRLRTQDPTLKPVVLYVTQENSLKESNERQYSVGLPSSISCQKKFEEREPEEIPELYKANGWNIRFARVYKESREWSTRDLANHCEKLKRAGYEVIAIIHDYIKRIRPTVEIGDPYTDYGTIVNEEKAIATRLQIPFITVMQVNREAVKKIQEAHQRGKKLEDELNASVIGDSFEIYQNTDYCAILIPREDEDGVKYLQFLKLKSRYKVESEGTYIAMPYEKGTIRLAQNLTTETSNVKRSWGDGLEARKPAQEVGSGKPIRKSRRTLSDAAAA